MSDLLQVTVPEEAMRLETARDPVIVTRLENGGLITYCRKDGTYLHTLDTESGFKRELEDLRLDALC